MKKLSTTLIFLFLVCMAWAQTARVQIIHNSASPTVDIWVNNTPFLTGFEYRTATPYVNVPAGQTLSIGVAPSPSSSPGDIIASFDVNFTPDETYAVIASGLVGNATTPFTLNVVEGTREAALLPGQVDLIVNHGATDAPAVDVIARNVATLVSNASYGDVTDYISVPASDYTLDVTPAGQPATVVASFNADLSGLAGGAAVVFASGFLSPAGNDPAFGLWVSLPDGTTFPLDLLSSTREAEEIESLSILPNPVSDYLTVNLDLSTATEIEFVLFDGFGRQVFRQSVGLAAGAFNQQLPMGDLPSGTYFLNIITATGSTVKNVMRQ